MSSPLATDGSPSEPAFSPAQHAAIAQLLAREQQRIARALHDTTCQSLTGIQILARLVARRSGGPASPEGGDAAELADLIRDAGLEIQKLVRTLGGGCLAGRSLEQALAELAQKVAEERPCECTQQPLAAAPPAAVAEQLYLCAEAATFEAVRSSREGPIRLTLEPVGHGLAIRIHSSGLPEGAGWMGPRDLLAARAAAVGAQLDITCAGQSATVSLRWEP